jgi:hypothetical protein
VDKKLELAINTLKMIRDMNSDVSELAGKTLDEIRRIDEEMSEM